MSSIDDDGGSGSGDSGDAGFLMEAGASGDVTRSAVLAWIPRVTGTLSLLGSMLILHDTLWVKRRQGRGRLSRKLYNELISSMSICDVFGSVGWILSTLPMPTTIEDEETEMEVQSNIYGARGDETTCIIQGVLMQFGLAGIFYFVSLTFYYLCTIRYGIREKRMTEMRWRFRLPPLVLGLVWTGFGLKEVDYTYVACYGETEEFVGSIVSQLPFWLSFLVTPVALFLTYQHVRATDLAANKWRFAYQSSRLSTADLQVVPPEQSAISSLSGDSAAGDSHSDASFSAVSSVSARSEKPSNQRRSMSSEMQRNSFSSKLSEATPPNQLTRAVFWQFTLYLFSFWLTWPIFFMGKLDAFEKNFAYLVFVVILTPLQGFFNAIVYFRPTVAKEYAAWKRSRQKKNENNNPRIVARATKSGSDKVGNLQSIPESSNELTNEVQKLPATIQASNV